MSNSIYTRLACTNLKNDHKTYVPYIFTSVLTVMMFYIMDALCQSKDITNSTLKLILDYAAGVIVVFSIIFLFYTNSFLIKRRKKELGVYYILGMGKRHIAKMVAVETFMIMAISIGMGLVTGIVFGKLMYLLLQKLLRYDMGMEFDISVISIQQTVILFTGIFLLILCYDLLQIRFSDPVELLQGSKQGEKEPKTKMLMTVFGIVALAAGYGITVIVENPLEALGGFFVAVICVILGTYALFTAGSIALLKFLKKKKSYYYQINHFTAVSGMLYRMKQNAAGLANICILSTMVLVMISTSFSLYMGLEDILDYRFPKDFSINYVYESDEKAEEIIIAVEEELKARGLKIEDFLEYSGTWFAGKKETDGFSLGEITDYTQKDVCDLTFMSLDDYNRIEGKNETLAADEILLYSISDKYEGDTVTIEGKSYNVKEHLKDCKVEERNWYSMVNGYYIIFPDREQVQKVIDVHNSCSTVSSSYMGRFTFNINGDRQREKEAAKAIVDRLQNTDILSCESRSLAEKSFYELYGSLLFIGIYLGVMFLMATVLIIYYKQISEGYDDRERYQIMQKVGMSREEVKRSVRSQVLMVFFLPLLTAILHDIVAFRIVSMLLRTLNLTNVPLYLMCTVVTICVFAIFYGVVYAITAREYYKIVNDR